MAGDLRFLDSLKGKRVVLTFHSLGDVDGVAAAFALKNYLGERALVVPADRVTSLSGKLLAHVGFSLDELPQSAASASAASPSARAPYDALVVLDCNSRMLMGRFSNEKPYAVIDHHSLHTDPLGSRNEFINPSYSSASEIVYEFLRERQGQKPLDSRIALLLAAGIATDSAGFRSSREKTFTYMGELLAQAHTEYGDLLELLEVPLNISERVELLRACQQAKVERKGNFLLATSLVKSYEAAAADALIALGADVAFVGYAGDDARISGRTTLHLAHTIQLTEIMARAGKLLGGSGGGHPAAAGATGPKKSKLKQALALCSKLALERLG
ncbi:MAG: DHH family phosphoesterase [Candidatus Burarchaeum sp.]|nr:DHH family phosphoesterase [Candidatus Burarchaeum sp.]MDO8339547.1 DHH family phosphoesterase [Candidatus Burarchaeum sp.]